MIWTATTTLLLLLLLLFVTFARRTRGKSEPPLDKGFIPWLGHALEFGKDAAKFLTRMKSKHGPIFTVRAAGRYVTVLLDPHSYDAVLSDTDSLDFTRYAQVLMERIFNMQLSRDQTDKAKDLMIRHFSGTSLVTVRGSANRHMAALLKAKTAQNQKDWKEEGLFNLCYSLLFKVGYLTLFQGEQNNNRTDPAEVYEEYKKFDEVLTKLARGSLTAGERKVAHGVRAKLWGLLAPAGLTHSMDSSPWLHAYRRLLQADGVDEETQKKAVLMQLWATQGNIGPAAFWLLGFLLTNPEALTAVKNEFKPISQMENDRPVDTPVFESSLQEALRLTSAPFITREVVQEKILQMADGQEYRLRKGDRVCLFPFISPQMDPVIYTEPQTFLYNRFLNEDGSVKQDFYKGGRRLKYFTMPWGAGTNGCVGKQFAINTIRQFVFKVLTQWDLELCDPTACIPDIDPSRHGFGMLQPEGDLLVRYRLKNLPKEKL